MSEYSCNSCCSTGILSATLIKDEENNNRSVRLVLCNHFDAETEDNIASIAATGIPIEYAQAEEDEKSQ